jgi:hypothetical protein
VVYFVTTDDTTVLVTTLLDKRQVESTSWSYIFGRLVRRVRWRDSYSLLDIDIDKVRAIHTKSLPRRIRISRSTTYLSFSNRPCSHLVYPMELARKDVDHAPSTGKLYPSSTWMSTTLCTGSRLLGLYINDEYSCLHRWLEV